MKKILFVAASHGDEPIGLIAVKKLKKRKLKQKFDYLIANPKAFRKNVRFTDADMNRVYPGSPSGNNEERRASAILNMTKKKKCDFVIDLHGTVSKTGVFGVITRLDLNNLKLSLMLNLKKIVIWPDSKESNGSLSTFTKCGMEIESGPKNNEKVISNLENTLADFLKNVGKEIDVKKEIKNKEFYTVIGKIAVGGCKEKLADWKKTKNFYPLFVNQYEGILCYKIKKVDPIKAFKNIIG